MIIFDYLFMGTGVILFIISPYLWWKNDYQLDRDEPKFYNRHKYLL